MKTRTRFIALTLSLTVSGAAALGCSKEKSAPPVTTSLPGGDKVPEDTAPKESPRRVPQEAYIRTYLSLFGGLSPLAVQVDARKANGLFDTWDDYLASLGLPDYSDDIPRGTETKSLMLATFERLGIALCDRAVARDLQGEPPAGRRRSGDLRL